jgi:diguanylate cyclase (GGDEF)-like protein
MRRSDASVIALLFACIAAIGFVDYVTGPDVGFSLFYLVPIVWSGWHINRTASVALALTAGASWLSAEVAWHGMTLVSLWNGFTRIGIYVAMAWLTSRLHAEQCQLQEANAKLQALLDHEKVLARTDSLTSLPNRRQFVDELKRAIARSHRTNMPIAVAYLDIDRFKPYNDRCGRVAGDGVLRSISEVLATHATGNGVAARVGGDEFALLLEQCTEKSAETSVARLLEDLQNIVGKLTSGAVGINIGVACFESPPLLPEAVIDHADAAMFCAKARGANSMFVTRLSTEPVPATRT